MASQHEDEIPEHLRPGNVLGRKYRVDGVLGVGGMGFVLAATHVALGERVALKLLLPEAAKHPDASARFLREARAAVRIKDEHVARVLDVDTLSTGEAFMVMERLDGADLATLVEQRGRLGTSAAVDCIVQACAALDEAHDLGIIHRDLKPANLFSTALRDGSTLIKVVDFGISKSSRDESAQVKTDTNAAMGSALYMSPEQMTSPKGVDQRTDIYSLGVTLFELLTGEAPFAAETVQALCAEVVHGRPASLAAKRPDVPPGLVRVVERAFARDRDHRPRTARELAAELAPFGSESSRALVARMGRGARGGSEPSFEHLPPAPGAPSSQVTTLMHASLAHPVPATRRAPLVAAGVLVGTLLAVVGIFVLARRAAPVEVEPSSVPPATPAVAAPQVEPHAALTEPTSLIPPEAPPSSTAAPPPSASVSGPPAAKRPAPRPTSAAAPTTPKSIYDGRR